MPRLLRCRPSASISPTTLSFSALTMRMPKCVGMLFGASGAAIALPSNKSTGRPLRLPFLITAHEVAEQQIGHRLIARCAEMHVVAHRQRRIGGGHAVD